MDRERFRRIDELVQRLEGLDPELCEREIGRVCAEDPSLGAEALALLRDIRASGSFPGSFPETSEGAHRPAFEASSLPRSEPPMPPIPDELGPYRLRDCLGEGGMGSVHRAERADGAFQGQVAVKILRAGPADSLTGRRFEAERQILADLDHPHIARLLDGGTAPDGRPYVVMELVEGEAIDLYCERRGLGLRARLRLFAKVVDAVAYVQRNLIVHRDIKPSNILVDARGEPKLLDFGIAKILDAEAFPRPFETTLPGHRPMTPAYASPEQISGRAITTASDVYSLGVLLYRLLCGSLPHDVRGLSLLEIERRHSEFAPRIPSQVLRESGRSAEARPLDGDLDSLVMMALRPEVSRRYGSAQELHQDLERFFAGLPIKARGDTYFYRSGKFLRRHWVGLLATGLVIVLLSASTLTMQRLAARAEAQRQKAELETDKAQKVTQLMTEIFVEADPMLPDTQGRDLTVREALDIGIERAREQLADFPDAQAYFFNSIGKAYQGLGNRERARGPLEEALALRRKAPGDQRRELSASLHELALLYHSAGDYQQAIDAHEEALELLEEVHGPEHSDIALVLQSLANANSELGRLQEAESYLRRALVLSRKFEGRNGLSVGRLHQILGTHYASQSKYQLAERHHSRSVEIALSARGPDHLNTGFAYSSRGLFYLFQGRYARAKLDIEKALEIREALTGKDHPGLVAILANLTGCLVGLRDVTAAEEVGRRLDDLMSRTGGASGGNAFYVASTRAGRLLLVGEADRARSVLEEALRIFEQEVGEERRPDMAEQLFFAEIDLHRGQAAAARTQAEAWIRRRQPDPDAGASIEDGSIQHGWARVLLARALDLEAEAQKARLEYEKSREILSSLGLDGTPFVLEGNLDLAWLELREGRAAQAEALFRSVVDHLQDVAERFRGPVHFDLLAEAQLGLARWHELAGRADRARDARQRAHRSLPAVESLENTHSHRLDLAARLAWHLEDRDRAVELADELRRRSWSGRELKRLLQSSVEAR